MVGPCSPVGAPPKGAVSRDKGAMVKLSKATYAKVSDAVSLGRLCIQGHLPFECDICRQEVKEQLFGTDKDTLWCLCEYHQREVGVLW